MIDVVDIFLMFRRILLDFQGWFLPSFVSLFFEIQTHFFDRKSSSRDPASPLKHCGNANVYLTSKNMGRLKKKYGEQGTW